MVTRDKVDGDPLSDINAMGRVLFTMKGDQIWFDPMINGDPALAAIGRVYEDVRR